MFARTPRLLLRPGFPEDAPALAEALCTLLADPSHCQALGQRSYEILDRQIFGQAFGESRGFVQQHVLHATGHAGQSISLRVCIVIKVGADALINRIDEYFDPAEIAPLLD